jgi:hypothetical protein
MSDVEAKSRLETAEDTHAAVWSSEPTAYDPTKRLQMFPLAGEFCHRRPRPENRMLGSRAYAEGTGT